MALFITKGVDRKTRGELAGIRKALERLADAAELHFGKGSGASLRSFYKDADPKAVDDADLSYITNEEAWAIEEAEGGGQSFEDYQEQQSYGTGGTEGEEQGEDRKR